jgi:hypothetical protein
MRGWCLLGCWSPCSKSLLGIKLLGAVVLYLHEFESKLSYSHWPSTPIFGADTIKVQSNSVVRSKDTEF